MVRLRMRVFHTGEIVWLGYILDLSVLSISQSFIIIMKTVYSIAWILLIIGGLNWLLVGILGWDVGMIFGGQAAIVSRIIYILVGLSAIYLIFAKKPMM